MENPVLPGTLVLDSDKLCKTYLQWQRSGKLADVVKSLVRPQKKEVCALKNLSLQLRAGEFVAYAGANGAGKSTTIKILCGLLQPTSGRVRVLGLSPADSRIALMCRIGVLFGQRTELWWDHPVVTSYEWKKTVWGIPETVYQENLQMVTELLDLGGLLHTFARELSLGQRMRADLGMLLLHSPEILFLDEPTLGLDVLAKRRMIDFLKQLNREKGTTIFVTSHDMDDLEEMARRIVLLSNGGLAFDGSFEELRRMQGGMRRICVTADAPAAEVEGLRLISSDGGVHTYAALSDQTPMQDILHRLAAQPGLLDIEMKKAPIEQVVAGLYQQWRR